MGHGAIIRFGVDLQYMKSNFYRSSNSVLHRVGRFHNETVIIHLVTLPLSAVLLITLWSIKNETLMFSITLANIDGFSYFHYYIQQGIAEYELVKIFASP